MAEPPKDLGVSIFARQGYSFDSAKEDQMSALGEHTVKPLSRTPVAGHLERKAATTDRIFQGQVFSRKEEYASSERRVEEAGRSDLPSAPPSIVLEEIPALSPPLPPQRDVTLRARIRLVETEIEPRLDIVGSRLMRGEEIGVRSIQQRMRELHVPGLSMAILQNGEEVWSQGYGQMEDQSKVSQAASISKTITALTVLSLVEDGTLQLDADVGALMRRDPQGRVLWHSIYPGDDGSNPLRYPPVTIRQLLSHTGGATVGGFGGYLNRAEVEKEIRDLQVLVTQSPGDPGIEGKIRALEQELQRAPTSPPKIDDILSGRSESGPVRIEGTPGTQARYSGGGTTILQKLIEIATGESFSSVVQVKLFNELGMEHSSFSPREEDKVQGNDGRGAVLSGKFRLFPTLAAAGLWTTPSDLAKVAIAIQKSLSGDPESILSKALAEEMVRGQASAPHNGLGVFVDKGPHSTYFYHEGDNPGYKTCLVANDHGDGLVVMTNSDNGEHLYNELKETVLRAFEWPDRAIELLPPLPPPMSERENEEWFKKFGGTYSDQGWNVTITRNEDGKISMEFSADLPQKWDEPPCLVFPLEDMKGCYRRYPEVPIETVQFSSDARSLFLFGGTFIRR